MTGKFRDGEGQLDDSDSTIDQRRTQALRIDEGGCPNDRQYAVCPQRGENAPGLGSPPCGWCCGLVHRNPLSESSCGLCG